MRSKEINDPHYCAKPHLGPDEAIIAAKVQTNTGRDINLDPENLRAFDAFGGVVQVQEKDQKTYYVSKGLSFGDPSST